MFPKVAIADFDFEKCMDNLSTINSEKLEKDNFQAQKFRMTNFLIEKGVWLFINGDEQEPILGVAPIVLQS